MKRWQQSSALGFNHIDPLEGTETKTLALLDGEERRFNHIDPLEGTETFNGLADVVGVYRFNHIDPLEGTETLQNARNAAKDAQLQSHRPA